METSTGQDRKNIHYMKTKLQPLSQLKWKNIKAYKRMKAFFRMNSIRGGSLLS